MKRSVKPLQSILIPKFILQLNLRQINIDNQLLQPLGYQIITGLCCDEIGLIVELIVDFNASGIYIPWEWTEHWMILQQHFGKSWKFMKYISAFTYVDEPV